jgi:biotin transporter BioY
MIPAIGYMVAFYIITRMLSLLLGKKDGKESIVTILFAAITILVALLGIYVLFTGEISSLDLSGF